jgi:undecaprenyl-diphosphatase
MLFATFIATFLILWGVFDLALPPLWRGISRLANRVASLSMRYGTVQRFIHATSRFRDYLPVIILVAAGIVVTGWAGDQFLDLAELVHQKSPELQKFDVRAHDWAVSRRTADATRFFATMSAIGGPAGGGAIAAIVLIALLLRRHFHRAAYLALTSGGGGVLDLELKRFFSRARPAVAEMLRQAHGYSFPSGHAMGSTVLFAALGYIAFRFLARWRWKAAAISLALTLIVAVALSRVYLGVHWISDVGAGIVCGLLWVTVTTVAYESYRRIHLIRTMAGKAEVRDA